MGKTTEENTNNHCDIIMDIGKILSIAVVVLHLVGFFLAIIGIGELDVDLELYTFVTVMYMFLGVLYAVQKFMGKFADKDVVPILSTALFSALCAMMDYGNRCQDTAPTTEIEDNCNLILTGGIFHAFAALITMLAPILMGGGGNAVSAS